MNICGTSRGSFVAYVRPPPHRAMFRSSAVSASSPTATVETVIFSRAILRTSVSKSPGFVSPSVRTMMCRRGAVDEEIAR